MPDLSPLATSVGELLKQRGDTIAITESSCGGLISAALVSIPGASAYFRGGAVSYTRVAHKALLGVPDSAMEGIRASSEPYAELNSRTVRASMETTWALSETGASGPTGNRYGDSAGHACFAVAGPVEPTTGTFFQPPNLMVLDGVSFKTLWEKAFNVPVWVGNDANLAALGEHYYGAGKESADKGRPVKTLFYVTVSTGVGGGVVDRLREVRPRRARIVGFIAGEKAKNPAYFANRVTEVWWVMRKRYLSGEMDTDDDPALIGQVSSRKYEWDSDGRIRLQSKKDMHRSPDEADALAAAVCHGLRAGFDRKLARARSAAGRRARA